LKDKVYTTNLHNLEELRNNIHHEISIISRQEVWRVNNMLCWCIHCIQSGGWHVQHLL